MATSLLEIIIPIQNILSRRDFRHSGNISFHEYTDSIQLALLLSTIAGFTSRSNGVAPGISLKGASLSIWS